MSPLDQKELAATIRGLVERLGSSVVGINSRGSGVVVGNGLVLTNTHNLGGAETVVTFADGRQVEATVAGADIDGDLAVLRVDTTDIAPFVEAEAEVELGTVVFGLSRPGGRSLRVTVGTVSSVDRAFRGPRGSRISGGVEHTAPLPRGSSGGPIVDAEGRLVGINTHRVDSGFYLALPTGTDFRRFVERAAAGEVTARRSLGIAVVPPAAARRMRIAVGLPAVEAPLIRALDENGPAARAGLRRGDQILRAGDVAVSTVEDLQRVLAETGSMLSLRILRGTEEIDVQVDFDSTEAPGGEA
jgi:S1-C subfamily serine protease